MKQTIFAPSTAPGRAGLAVIRISGDEARTALEGLVDVIPPARRASLRRLVDAASGEALDEALVLWFPAPASFTGEDVVELHLHGGAGVTSAVLVALARIPGLRPAEPGEFTRRAVGNGRLDVTAAEGLADLVAAETEAQRRQALRQYGGALCRLYEGWREALVGALARYEAAIDFPEEGLPVGLRRDVGRQVSGLRDEITGYLADGRRGERLRDGIFVAIVGAPNVGKSSLLNILAGRDAAIVSQRAGTTRDVIETRLDIGGFPVILADTAGLRESRDDIEEEGVRRALARAADADLTLAVIDAAVWPEGDGMTRGLVDSRTMVVANKVDLREVPPASEWQGRPVYPLSCRTGDGVDALLDALEEVVSKQFSPGATAALTRLRHRVALEGCVAALGRFAGSAEPELCAEDLRLAARELGRLTGRVDTEELLDRIFAEFCIGK